MPNLLDCTRKPRLAAIGHPKPSIVLSHGLSLLASRTNCKPAVRDCKPRLWGLILGHACVYLLWSWCFSKSDELGEASSKLCTWWKVSTTDRRIKSSCVVMTSDHSQIPLSKCHTACKLTVVTYTLTSKCFLVKISRKLCICVIYHAMCDCIEYYNVCFTIILDWNSQK